MTKKILLVVFSLLVFGCLAWAADQTWTGTVSDSHCGLNHSTPSAAAAQCVEKCVAGGAKYVLVSGGKVYQLDPQAEFKGKGGTEVKVTGTLSGDTITVSGVTEPAEEPK
jgi:hypothetical protein